MFARNMHSYDYNSKYNIVIIFRFVNLAGNVRVYGEHHFLKNSNLFKTDIIFFDN